MIIMIIMMMIGFDGNLVFLPSHVQDDFWIELPVSPNLRDQKNLGGEDFCLIQESTMFFFFQVIKRRLKMLVNNLSRNVFFTRSLTARGQRPT